MTLHMLQQIQHRSFLPSAHLQFTKTQSHFETQIPFAVDATGWKRNLTRRALNTKRSKSDARIRWQHVPPWLSFFHAAALQDSSYRRRVYRRRREPYNELVSLVSASVTDRAASFASSLAPASAGTQQRPFKNGACRCDRTSERVVHFCDSCRSTEMDTQDT